MTACGFASFIFKIGEVLSEGDLRSFTAKYAEHANKGEVNFPMGQCISSSSRISRGSRFESAQSETPYIVSYVFGWVGFAVSALLCGQSIKVRADLRQAAAFIWNSCKLANSRKAPGRFPTSNRSSSTLAQPLLGRVEHHFVSLFENGWNAFCKRALVQE